MATLTRQDLRSRMGREIPGAAIFGSTTSAGLSGGDNLVDTTRLRDANLSAASLQNALVLVTSGNAAGDIRRVREYEPKRGWLWATPPFSAQIASSVTFEIWRLPVLSVGTADALEKELIHQAIDDAIARAATDYRWRHYLTLVADGDMEASNTTSWTASNSSLTKSTTTVGEGVRSLRVQNSSANGYAESQAIGVFEDRQYLVEATCYPDTGTPNLIVWDSTNAEAIKTIDPADADQLGFAQTDEWIRLWAYIDIPSGSRQVTIRLAGEESTADIYWENIIFRQVAATRATLPTWVTNRNRIYRLVTRRPGVRYREEMWQPFPYSQDAFIQNPASVQAELRHDMTNQVLAVEGNRANSALTTVGTALTTNDAASVIGDEDLLLAWCMVELLSRLSSGPGRDNSSYEALRQQWLGTASRLAGTRQDRRRQARTGSSIRFASGRWR